MVPHQLMLIGVWPTKFLVIVLVVLNRDSANVCIAPKFPGECPEGTTPSGSNDCQTQRPQVCPDNTEPPNCTTEPRQCPQGFTPVSDQPICVRNPIDGSCPNGSILYSGGELPECRSPQYGSCPKDTKM